MTLASRLSTQANLGNMVSGKEITHMVIGNIALVQVQATVAAFIVSIFSLTVGFVLSGTFNFEHALLLTASSMFTATTSCFVLGESIRSFNWFEVGGVALLPVYSAIDNEVIRFYNMIMFSEQTS